MVPDQETHIHLHISTLSEERIEELMAKIDEVQAAFTSLDTSVRTFLQSQQDTIENLQTELDGLRADDSIENSKLEGLQSGIDRLRTDVESFSPPEQPPTEPTEPEPTEPTP